jgi:hypothetical protein
MDPNKHFGNSPQIQQSHKLLCIITQNVSHLNDTPLTKRSMMASFQFNFKNSCYSVKFILVLATVDIS